MRVGELALGGLLATLYELCAQLELGQRLLAQSPLRESLEHCK